MHHEDAIISSPPWDPSDNIFADAPWKTENKLWEDVKREFEVAQEIGLENIESANELCTHTIAQVARMTGRPHRAIYNLVRKGDIDAHMTGSQWMIPYQEAQRLLAELQPEPVSGPTAPPNPTRD